MARRDRKVIDNENENIETTTRSSKKSARSHRPNRMISSLTCLSLVSEVAAYRVPQLVRTRNKHHTTGHDPVRSKYRLPRQPKMPKLNFRSRKGIVAVKRKARDFHRLTAVF